MTKTPHALAATVLILVSAAGCREAQRPVAPQDTAALPEWSAYWRRQPPGVKASRARVILTVAKQVRVLAKGHISLAVTIENLSRLTLKTSLAHEWHGGMWPPTDLYLSSTPVDSQKLRAFHPAYLLGESAEATKPTIIPPGRSKSVNIRMDWWGTGSVKGVPLMNLGAGAYKVYPLLVFTADGKKQYVMGPGVTVGTEQSKPEK